MILPFDELNELILKYDLPFLAEFGQEEVEDDIYDLLIAAFIYGVSNVNEMLGTNIETDALMGERIIHERVAGKTWRDRVHEYFETAYEGESGELYVTISGQKTALSDALMRIAESETTRIFNETMQKIAEIAVEIIVDEDDEPRKVMKRWNTMRDERVREQHRFLDGVEIPLGDKFHTIDGDEALYPGGFMTAQENCGCRCFITFRTI